MCLVGRGLLALGHRFELVCEQIVVRPAAEIVHGRVKGGRLEIESDGDGSQQPWLRFGQRQKYQARFTVAVATILQ